MKQFTLSLCIVLAFTFVVSAQKARKAAPEPTLAEDIDLTDGKPCGDPRFATSERLTGTVMARSFADDEISMSGVVIRDRKDIRRFINIDYEFLKDHFSGNTLDSLSEVLLVGKYIRLDLDKCGKIYVLRRVRQLRL